MIENKVSQKEGGMNLISQYVLRVAAYVIFSLILEEITPKGSNKKIVKLNR